MSWHNVDWLKVEADIFLDEIKTIDEVYDRMNAEFDEAFKKHKAEAINAADAERSVEMLNWYVDVRETEQRMLTAMILAATFRSVEDLLRRYLTYFFRNDQFPKSRHGSDLGNIIPMFDQIGVRLADQQEFEIINEMRFARNFCIHYNNVPSKKYLQHFPNPRWRDASNKISLGPGEWKDLIGGLSKWADDLRGRLHASKKQNKAAADPAEQV